MAARKTTTAKRATPRKKAEPSLKLVAPAKAKRTETDWLALARHLGQPAQYSISVTGTGEHKVERRRHWNPETREYETIEERKTRTYAAQRKVIDDAARALKEVAAQDTGHARIAAHVRAQQSADVVHLRAAFLKADYERFHLRQDLASHVSQKLSYSEADRMRARIRELDSDIRTIQADEKAAYEKAYKAELKAAPEPRKPVNRKPKPRPHTVGSYEPAKVSIAEIAGARRNSRVLDLERKAARENTPQAHEAYHRARDKEIMAMRGTPGEWTGSKKKAPAPAPKPAAKKAPAKRASSSRKKKAG